jgi:hypothetical protein
MNSLSELAMSHDEFFDQLRSLRWREPFVPFRVELRTGERIIIDTPVGLAFNQQFGIFDAPQGESYEFSSADVVRFDTVPTQRTG